MRIEVYNVVGPLGSDNAVANSVNDIIMLGLENRLGEYVSFEAEAYLLADWCAANGFRLETHYIQLRIREKAVEKWLAF